MSVRLPAVVSVAGMARLVGLSRQHFHQLMRQGVFPPPVYDTATRRPHYTEEMQRLCLAVKEQNRGVNGRAVLFYAPRKPVSGKTLCRRSASPTRDSKLAGLIEGLKGLGLSSVNEQSVVAAMKDLYPNGTAHVDEADLLRSIFVHLMGRTCGDKVRR